MPTADETYLTEAEIERLTGRTSPAAQCRRLVAIEMPFIPDADGRPLVLRAVHDQRAGLKREKVPRGPRLAGLAAAR